MIRLLAALALMLATVAPARSQALTVFAAASLTNALQDAAQLWEARGGSRLRLSFGASSTLARQLDQGAQAALFASADLKWMDWAQARGLIATDTRRTVLGNRLVLVMPHDHLVHVTIASGFDLAALLGATGRLAVGDPSHVPAGIYAKQALTRLGLWPAIEPRLARAENVRSALLLVERGEAPAGVVYATDAMVAPGVGVAGSFPPDSHDAIEYPFAVTRAGDSPAARKLLDFLAGPDAARIFAKRGFAPAAGN